MTVSIRAPRAGGDPDLLNGYSHEAVFQSAPPVREATRVTVAVPMRTVVSIRAPRAGGDRAAV